MHLGFRLLGSESCSDAFELEQVAAVAAEIIYERAVAPTVVLWTT